MFPSPRIWIAPTAKIKKSAIVELRIGGSICVGDDTELLDHVCLMSYGGNIKIGNNCSINPFTIIYGHGGDKIGTGDGGTTIGDNVLIAGHCMIIPSNHNFSRTDIPIRMQGNASKGIVIEDDVWIGHGCTILDGVTVGRGAVVAAGSVVNKSVPPMAVVGGIPARLIRMRGEGTGTSEQG